MSGPGSGTPEKRQRLEEAIAAYLVAADEGRPLDVDAFLDAYPDVRTELEEFLANQSGLVRLISPIRPVAIGSPIRAIAIGVGHDVTWTAPDAPMPEGPSDGPTGSLQSTGPEHETVATHVRYFGDYELTAELGHGGMGVVYQARQVSLNRPVALKMIRAGVLASQDELRRFRNEAEAVALLDHPSIVAIHEVGEHDGQQYFSMKLVPGGNLGGHLADYNDNFRAAARIVLAVAEAVHHAHTRGILHRDLKPANVLIDDLGHPHVTDFGLARKLERDRDITASGALIGTPSYMSPEQASGRPGSISTATDVHGLGAILYALLTGKAPFAGNGLADTLAMVRTQPPEAPRRANPRVPRDLEVICLKCLEKNPRRRYASADALAEDLQRWLAGKPIAARPVGALERSWMWCRRHPAPAALGAALGLAVLAGSIVSTWFWLHAERNLRLEQQARRLAQKRFDLSVEAIRTFHTGVSEDVLLKEPKMKALRDRLLVSALEFYKLLQDTLVDDPDPKAQAALADSYQLVGEITASVGSFADAQRAFRRALDIRERLLALEPAKEEYQRALATSLMQELSRGVAEYTTFGDMIEGRTTMAAGGPEAAATYERALAIRERLAARHPASLPMQVELASSLATPLPRPATLLAHKDYVERLRANAARLERMVEAYPSVAELRRSLALICVSIGVYTGNTGDIEGRMVAFQQTLEHLQRMPGGPGEKDVEAQLLVHLNRGYYLNCLGLLSEATGPVDEALELAERLVASKPAVTSYRFHLGRAFFNLGHNRVEMQRLSEAETALRRSRELLGVILVEDASPEARRVLAEAEIMLGKIEAGTGRADQAFETLRHAVAYWLERSLVDGPDYGVLQNLWNLLESCCPIVELPDSVVPANVRLSTLRDIRERFEENDLAGLLTPVARLAFPLLDIQIARLQFRMGEIGEARETARLAESEVPLAALKDDFGSTRYQEASLYSMLSTVYQGPDAAVSTEEAPEVQRLQDEAMRRLHQAVAAGVYRDPTILRATTSFDPLFVRPDFQLLLQDLAFPAVPFDP
jgi:tetratricopeptide (TPR) repeat protein